MNIKPLFDRVLLKPIKEEKKSSIILPDSTNKSSLTEVVALGEQSHSVELGDKVLINQFAGSEFVLNNQNYILIKECDILAVVKGE